MNIFLTWHHMSLGLLVLRLGVGVVFFVHAMQKFSFWKAQPEKFQMTPGMVNLMKFLSIAETLGSVAVITGFLTQLAAVGLGIIMLGAIYTKINKFKKKFTGDGGWELDFIILCATITLFFLAGGAFALDRMFFGI
jgi:putative oxidoreductase